MAETDFTSDITAENGNNLEEPIQEEEPNPERKFSTIRTNRVHMLLLETLIQKVRPITSRQLN